MFRHRTPRRGRLSTERVVVLRRQPHRDRHGRIARGRSAAGRRRFGGFMATPPARASEIAAGTVHAVAVHAVDRHHQRRDQVDPVGRELLDGFTLPAPSLSTATLPICAAQHRVPVVAQRPRQHRLLERLGRRAQRREPLPHRHAGQPVLRLEPLHQVGRIPRVVGDLARRRSRRPTPAAPRARARSRRRCPASQSARRAAPIRHRAAGRASSARAACRPGGTPPPARRTPARRRRDRRRPAPSCRSSS